MIDHSFEKILLMKNFKLLKRSKIITYLYLHFM